jgi:hypothetical protein
MLGDPEPNLDALLCAFWDEWRCCNEEKSIRLAKSESTRHKRQYKDEV